MPFRFSTGRRGTARRPFRRFRRRSTVGRKIHRAIVRNNFKNTELKYFCVEDTFAVDTTGVLRSLVKIPQGLQEGERVGDQVSLKRLVFRGRLVVADSSNDIRIIIVALKKDGANVALTDFPKASTPTMEPYGCYTTLKKQYHVLYDVIHHVNSTSVSKNLNLNIKLGFDTTYAGSGTAAGINNDLVMYIISDSSVATHPVIAYNAQISYTDG